MPVESFIEGDMHDLLILVLGQFGSHHGMAFWRLRL